MNVVDKLIENTIRTKNPSVIGLDPDIGKIPACYKVNAKSNNPFEAVANVIYEFNRDVIDTVADFIFLYLSPCILIDNLLSSLCSNSIIIVSPTFALIVRG